MLELLCDQTQIHSSKIGTKAAGIEVNPAQRNRRADSLWRSPHADALIRDRPENAATDWRSAGADRHQLANDQSKTATGRLQPVAVLAVDGAPSTTRTCDLLDRNQTLYPTELWARFKSGAEAYRIADDSEYLAERAVCSELVSGRKSLICWEDTGKYNRNRETPARLLP